MKLACPSCHHPVEVLEVDSELSAQVSCPQCAAVVGITVAVSILSPGAAREGGPRVVLAMTDREMRGAYARALVQAGIAVTETGDSRQTLQVLSKEVPQVAVVDGDFSAIFGMGIGEIIKKSNVTRDTRVLGLRVEGASPLPVPGADRTVAITVGADAIVREVQAMLDAPRPAAPARPRPAAPAPPPPRREVPRMAAPEPPRPAPAPTPASAPTPTPTPTPTPAPTAAAAPPRRAAGGDTPSDPEHAAAQRLARIIVSDTALYNQPMVDEAIRSGRLRETLVPLLQEGRQHYEERTPAHVRNAADYLGDALDQFVARKMKAMKPTAA